MASNFAIMISDIFSSGTLSGPLANDSRTAGLTYVTRSELHFSTSNVFCILESQDDLVASHYKVTPHLAVVSCSKHLRKARNFRIFISFLSPVNFLKFHDFLASVLSPGGVFLLVECEYIATNYKTCGMLENMK